MVVVSKAGLRLAQAQARGLKLIGLGLVLFATALAAAPLLGRAFAGYALGIVAAAGFAAAGFGLAILTKKGWPVFGIIALYVGGFAFLVFLFLGPQLTGLAFVLPCGLLGYLAARGNRHAANLAILTAPAAFTFTAWWTRADSSGQALWGAALASLGLLGSELLRVGVTSSRVLEGVKAGPPDPPEGAATMRWVTGTVVGRIFSSAVWIGSAFLVSGLLVLNRETLASVDILASVDVALAAAILALAGVGLAYLTVRKAKAPEPQAWPGGDPGAYGGYPSYAPPRMKR